MCLGLHDRVTADDLLGLDERSVGHDLVASTTRPSMVRASPGLSIQPLAIASPIHAPHFCIICCISFGRHLGFGVAAATVHKQEFGHRKSSFRVICLVDFAKSSTPRPAFPEQ